MSRATVLVGSFLALVASLGLGVDTTSSATNLKAEQVIEKNLAARGGLQAWRGVQRLSISGKVDKTVSSLMIPYVMETKVHGVKQPEKIEIENIAVNPRVEDSRFAKLQ
ncbi:MAG: hypothetical protein DMG78_04120 [Acidobacteria bacterium]|nr:MAG: hypothetical protein DMG78_04120 [Acidobacteriota bacterium]